MITIRLIDDSCERYTQKRDCSCLGRRWDNIAEKVKVIKPKGEENNVCAMIMLHDNKIIDHIIVGEEPIDITSNASQYSNIQIGFSFSNETGYIKNSEVVDYYFAEAIKPTDFVPMPPTQEENINNLIGKSFVRSELIGNILNFYNIVGDVISSVDLSGFAGGGGSGGGIVDETDPTVPSYVKEITEENISSWNSKVDQDQLNGIYETITGLGINKANVSYVEQVESIAKGANQAISFPNYQSMVEKFLQEPIDAYNIGQSVLIETLNVPDLWISEIPPLYESYTYTTDEDFVNQLSTNGNVKVGLYVFSPLETQKVNLTDYVKNTDYATGSKAGLVKGNSNQGFYIGNGGDMSIVQATDNDITNRTNKYRPITSNNLDKAVNSVLKERIVLTQKENGAYTLTINKE